VLAAVATLAVVCTALAFVLFLQLVAEVGPARATVITYVNPAVAIGLGVLVLDEPFTAAIATGFVLVLAGSVLATSGRGGPHADGPGRLAPVRGSPPRGDDGSRVAIAACPPHSSAAVDRSPQSNSVSPPSNSVSPPSNSVSPRSNSVVDN
jgi:hypothetical protein